MPAIPQGIDLEQGADWTQRIAATLPDGNPVPFDGTYEAEMRVSIGGKLLVLTSDDGDSAPGNILLTPGFIDIWVTVDQLDTLLPGRGEWEFYISVPYDGEVRKRIKAYAGEATLGRRVE